MFAADLKLRFYGTSEDICGHLILQRPKLRAGVSEVDWPQIHVSDWNTGPWVRQCHSWLAVTLGRGLVSRPRPSPTLRRFLTPMSIFSARQGLSSGLSSWFGGCRRPCASRQFRDCRREGFIWRAIWWGSGNRSQLTTAGVEKGHCRVCRVRGALA